MTLVKHVDSEAEIKRMLVFLKTLVNLCTQATFKLTGSETENCPEQK